MEYTNYEYAKMILDLSSAQGQDKAPDNRPVANCDQESWVKSRIHTAIRMAFALKEEQRVAAEDGMYLRGLDGIIEGAAEAIIETLGLKPEYINITKRERL